MKSRISTSDPSFKRQWVAMFALPALIRQRGLLKADERRGRALLGLGPHDLATFQTVPDRRAVGPELGEVPVDGPVLLLKPASTRSLR